MAVKALIKRHLTVYLRDRWAVFFSFLSVMIILVLFMLFLRNSFGGEFNQISGADLVMNTWILSGVLMVSTVTVPLGFLGIMVVDVESKTINDFYVAPIERKTIVISYLAASIIIGMLLSLANLLLGQLYLYFSFGVLISAGSLLQVLGLMVVSITLFSALFFYVVSFLKTSNAHATLSTLIGTLIGFLAGLYVPIGVLGSTTRNVLSFLPTMQIASLFRVVYMKDALSKADWPVNYSQDWYESFVGVQLELFGSTVPVWGTLLFALGWIFLFIGLSVFRLKHFKKQ